MKQERDESVSSDDQNRSQNKRRLDSDHEDEQIVKKQKSHYDEKTQDTYGLNQFPNSNFQNQTTQMMIYENLMKKNAAVMANAVQNFTSHHFQSSTTAYN